MWEIYELCQLGLRDSSLVRAWKIGLNNFPFTAAISCLHLGERPPTREHINRPVCLWACKISHSVRLLGLGGLFIGVSCSEARVYSLCGRNLHCGLDLCKVERGRWSGDFKKQQTFFSWTRGRSLLRWNNKTNSKACELWSQIQGWTDWISQSHLRGSSPPRGDFTCLSPLCSFIPSPKDLALSSHCSKLSVPCWVTLC